MKTNELIRLLKEEDPSGELEVCAGNEDIFIVCKRPAYYDGMYEHLIRDGREGYDVVGAKLIGKGDKVNLISHPIEMAIMDNPDLPVEIEGGGPTSRFFAEEQVRKWREEARET